MAITDASDTHMRGRVWQYLRNLRERNPGAAVLDIGGAANPWCDEYVTTYADLRPVPTTREVLLGDICDSRFRDSMNGRRWDFAICTHVLEDIRDPRPVVEWMQRVARAGFIAVPNKHTEVSAISSPHYPGYYSHRWIFTLQGQTLRAVAKLPLLGYYRKDNYWLHRLQTGGPLLRRLARVLTPRAFPDGGMPPWLDPAKAKHGLELAFIWEDSFEFEYLNGDYCGPDAEAMNRWYIEGLREGL